MMFTQVKCDSIFSSNVIFIELSGLLLRCAG